MRTSLFRYLGEREWVLASFLCIIGTPTILAEEITPPLGGLVIPETAYASLRESSVIPGAATNQPKWSLRPMFPPPQKQVSGDNSCTPFAVAYALRGFLERQEKGPWRPLKGTGWDRKNSAYWFSPAYPWNRHVAEGHSKGMLVTEAFDLLTGGNTCRWQTYPYPSSPGSLAGNRYWDAWKEAQKFREDWEERYRIRVRRIDVKDRDKLKGTLMSNTPIIITAMVEADYDWPLDADGVTKGYFSPYNSGLHTMVLIGFDNRKGENDARQGGFGKGAFEVMNSWGSDWNDNGHAWISYGFWDYWVKQGMIYVRTEREPSSLSRATGVAIPPGPLGLNNGNFGYRPSINPEQLAVKDNGKVSPVVRREFARVRVADLFRPRMGKVKSHQDLGE